MLKDAQADGLKLVYIQKKLKIGYNSLNDGNQPQMQRVRRTYKTGFWLTVDELSLHGLQQKIRISRIYPRDR
jgi:hypothetical protein